MADYVKNATVMYSNPLITPEMAEAVGKQVFGLVYTPCRLTLRGRPNQRAGDVIRAYDSKGQEHTVLIMEQTIRISSGLKSTISCTGELSEDTEFYATPPSGKEVQVANSETVAQMQAYANQGDASVLAQAKAYTDAAITAALEGSY